MVLLCWEVSALYLDTAIEPWPDLYRNARVPLVQRTSYALREALRESLRESVPEQTCTTALVAHGANPGLVFHFMKYALLSLATNILGRTASPHERADWAALVETLGVKVIHITERDTQAAAAIRSSGEFVNTWLRALSTKPASPRSSVGVHTNARCHLMGAAIMAAEAVCSWRDREAPLWCGVGRQSPDHITASCSATLNQSR